MELRVSENPAADAAQWLARRLRDAVRLRGRARIAVSGGSTAPELFEALARLDVPWNAVEVWQVDERVAPDGDAQRNALQLALLPELLPALIHLMPVTAIDLDVAAAGYGELLVERFDVVHLGLGDDGHTASWPPGHGVVDSSRRCEVIGEFNGFARMTLTPRVVNAARSRLLLTHGAAKAPIIARWLLRDPDLPVDRVRRSGTWAFVDASAAADLPSSGPR